jgi:predicted nucleotidyltransferase component of viral defense system
MINKEKHQLIMGQILKDIYSDTSINSLLGFKGGTCAYFFYNLPRFSVDLDFDLLSISKENINLVHNQIVAILNKYGTIKNKIINEYTFLTLLSYGPQNHSIKIEINLRNIVNNIREQYELKKYLGISIPVAKQEYLFAGKLSALTLRDKTAMRDIFDIYYFSKNLWDINTEVIKNLTGTNLKDCLSTCIRFIEDINNSQILQGLGELISSEKEKDWIKKNLKSETIFMLKNYQSVLRGIHFYIND